MIKEEDQDTQEQESFHRHYKPRRNYYSTAAHKLSIAQVRKRSLRISFINIVVIALLFGAISYFHKNEKTSTPIHSSLSSSAHPLHIEVQAKALANRANIHITLAAEPQAWEDLLPIELQLSWQGTSSPFAHYIITDSMLTSDESLTITHEELAMRGAVLYVQSKPAMQDYWLTIIKSVE